MTINFSAIISHDSTIKKSSHITPGAILAGNLTVGKRCTIKWDQQYIWD